MGKRVYELAKELGLENKDLVDRLKAAGVEVKSHMSMLEAGELARYESAQEAPKHEEVVERVVKPGLIRRRKVMTDAGDTHAEDAEVVEAAAESHDEPRHEVEVPAPAVVREEPPVAKEPPPAPKEVPVEVAVEAPQAFSAPEPPATPEAPVAAPAAAPIAEEVAAPPVKEHAHREVYIPPASHSPRAMTPHDASKRIEPDKATASRAKILGRVELPQMRRPASAGDQGSRPPRREDSRPGQGRPSSPSADRPSTPGSDRPRSDRPGSDRPGSDRPASARPGSDRPGAGRPGSDRPGSSRPGGAPRPGGPGAGRPGAPRPGGAAPSNAPPDAMSEEKKRGKKRKKTRFETEAEEAAKAGGKHLKVSRRGKDVDLFEPEGGSRMRKSKKKEKRPAKQESIITKAVKRIIRISDSITVGELAKRMGIKAKELIAEMMRQGTMVTINQPLDYETAVILASEFQYEVENVAFDEDTILEATEDVRQQEEAEENLVTRPPVVTIMGHVDHGKTSLLDAIRKTRVTEGEAGGITQHIGAYDVEIHDRKITFLDTPGHEAFTAMRARGAQVTDIVVLVVAADDGVMPQTKEAVNHSKAAKVPIIVAINKMDKPEANPDRVKQELTEFALVPEEWGGDTIFVEVSAKAQTNLDQLLEMILLQAEVLELKANPDKRAKGTIVESRLDRGRGPVATVLVQEGTLRVGDAVVAGQISGKVRSMTNHLGKPVKEAGPSFPVEVTGLDGVPNAGEVLHSVENEKLAKEVAQHRQHKQREAELAKITKVSLEQLFAKIQKGDMEELKVILKADVQGSVEAVRESLEKLSTERCRLVVLHTAVGGINESDVSLAAASDAIILGFNVRPEVKAAQQADSDGVDIRMYSIIYDAVNDVRSAMEGLLKPTFREQTLGRVEVRETFAVSRVGTIAGCYVLDGKIVRNAQARLVRNNVVIWTGKLNSLKRFKDDAREVTSGYECGIGLENYNDIKVGDIVEAFTMEEVKTTL